MIGSDATSTWRREQYGELIFWATPQRVTSSRTFHFSGDVAADYDRPPMASGGAAWALVSLGLRPGRPCRLRPSSGPAEGTELPRRMVLSIVPAVAPHAGEQVAQ